MRKTLICLLVALCLCAACAGAEGGRATFTLRFDEGFMLSLPEGWVSYPAGDAGICYALGDAAGERFLYILAEPTSLATFDELSAAIEAREDCGRISALDLNGHDFAAFIAPPLNASGCATLWKGELLIFLFTPQDDSEYMLTVAEIMGSFRPE